jgi:hypothetical protein
MRSLPGAELEPLGIAAARKALTDKDGFLG